MLKKEIKQFAIEEYNRSLQERESGSSNNVSKSKRASMRRETIFSTFQELLKKFPDENPGLIWRIVENAHVYSYLNNEGIDIEVFSKKYGIPADVLEELLFDDELISSFDSAKQSWKRASGLAWENYFEGTFVSGTDEIKVIGSSDMKKLLLGNHINNREGVPSPLHFFDVNQMEYFNSLLNKKDFDLFLLFYSSYHKKWRLFGLVQCKTSIRDRIKINASTSIEAMNNHLWSILLALDPDNFLRGQYYDMAKANWHGVYFMEKDIHDDDNIIYGPLEHLQKTILEHANKVLQIITDKPEKIDSGWRIK